MSTETKRMHERLLALIAEQHPFAVPIVREALGAKKLLPEIVALAAKIPIPKAETTPFVPSEQRLQAEVARLTSCIEGFYAREQLAACLTAGDKLRLLRGMILTRAVDITLKRMFLSGEPKFRDAPFQGKGFRSLGQEAIYAAALGLQHGPTYSRDGAWHGDVVAPLIRDLGVALAFTDHDVDTSIESALNAQAGKSGPPLDGADLHIGALMQGVFPPAAPLGIATSMLTGMAMAAKLKGEKRAFVSFIGDGGSSLGEWHEAVNMAATNGLPMVFCVQNNQTALSTPVHQQSAARVFGDKAIGYGMPHITIDGTDPEAIFAAFTWATDLARGGGGPALIELVCMRMCGHAHHDDMLYLGQESEPSFELPMPNGNGYVDKALYERWAAKDPIKAYARKLVASGLCTDADVQCMKDEALQRCKAALERLKERPWPESGASACHASLDLASTSRVCHPKLDLASTAIVTGIDNSPLGDPKGITFLEAIALAVGHSFDGNPSAYMLGEDVAPPYGNVFMLLRSQISAHGKRFINTPIAESAIIGTAAGMALAGLKPVGEIQFNDFVATGFNVLVNGVAKFHYRTGHAIAMVLRMPWGGLRHAGPYHSQDTSPWFYRTPGLKIVCPSTPIDAYGLFLSAMAEPDPVLFYEHIALYRDPSIRQVLPKDLGAIPIGSAAWVRGGDSSPAGGELRMDLDMCIISYGAYVHRAAKVADELSKQGHSVGVLDLRSLMPLDWGSIERATRRAGKIMLVGEDSKTGSILESIASGINERFFDALDGPVTVLGAADAPVPYSPPLEEAHLLSHSDMVEAAQALIRF